MEKVHSGVLFYCSMTVTGELSVTRGLILSISQYFVALLERCMYLLHWINHYEICNPFSEL